MKFIEKIIRDHPLVHSGETEMTNFVVTKESTISVHQQDSFAKGLPACWGLGEKALEFISDSIGKESHTLEIGSGLTTLVFAHKKSQHICITPSKREIDVILQYAASEKIDTFNIVFINDFSEVALPKITVDHPLDLVLIDGKHAFPWPFIDWFYTANHLRKEGILIVDDTHLITGRFLCDFMKSDPSWEFISVIDGKTEVFRKKADDIRNIAWHMQPFITEEYSTRKKNKSSLFGRIRVKLRSLFR